MIVAHEKYMLLTSIPAATAKSKPTLADCCFRIDWHFEKHALMKMRVQWWIEDLARMAISHQFRRRCFDVIPVNFDNKYLTDWSISYKCNDLCSFLRSGLDSPPGRGKVPWPRRQNNPQHFSSAREDVLTFNKLQS